MVDFDTAGDMLSYRHFSRERPDHLTICSNNGIKRTDLAYRVRIIIFPGHVFIRIGKKDHKCRPFFYILASLALGLVCVTFVPYPERAAGLVPHTISVISQNTVTCQPAVLTGMRNDGVFISYSSFISRGWERNQNTLISNQGENSLYWKGFSRDSVMMFLGSSDACLVKITIDGVTTTYNLASQSNAEIVVHNNLAQPPWVLWITFLSLWIPVACLFLFIILMLRQVMFFCGVENQSGPHTAIQIKTVLYYAGLAILLFLGYFLTSATFHLLFEGDSSSYLSAGHSLAVGNGYLSDNGDHFDWWPPLYPFLLSGGYIQSLINIDSYLYILHGVLFVLTALGSQVLLNTLFPQINRLLLMMVNLAAAFSAPILGSYLYILSESGFLPAIIWGLVFLFRFLHFRSFNDLFACGLCVLASTLFRYIGIIFVITSAFCLFFFLKADLRRKILGSLSFSLFASIPEIFWLGRNIVLTGTATGLRTPSTLSPMEVLSQSNQTMVQWFVPQNTLLTSLLISLALGVSLVILIKRIRSTRSNSALSACDIFYGTLLFFTCAYLLFIWRTMMVVANSNLGDRFLAPVYFPLVILIINAGSELFPADSKNQLALRQILPAILVLMMGIPAYNHITRMRMVDTNSYQTAYTRIIRQDRLIQYLLQNPMDEGVPVVTNCPDCLSFATHTYNSVYIDDEDYSRAFFQKVKEPFYLVLFPQAKLPFETTGSEWDLQKEDSHIGSTLKRLVDRQFSARMLERNEDGAMFYLTPQ